MIMDDIKMIQKEGHVNFNVLSLMDLIKCLMMTIDKKEFNALLDKYLGRGVFVNIDEDGLFSIGRKERTPQTVTDEKEDILNLLELKPELHLTSMQIKWLNEWQCPQNIAPEPQRELIDLLPDRLKNDEAVSVFQRAIDAKMIEKNATGLKWLQIGERGRKAQLAYFCGRLCGYENSPFGNRGGRVCYTELEKLFGETRLDRALEQVWDAKPQWWRKKIDALFK